MKRIIIHWTAGHYAASELDLLHYHFVIDGMGKVHPGKFPVVANEAPQKGRYAAHTLNCNTGSIGVAVAAMAGAQERPFNRGSAPILQAQLAALAALCADLGRDYGIPITRQTMLTHAEVQLTLGIQQRGKWDISWLPGMTAVGDPVIVGDKIRAMIKAGPPMPVDDTPMFNPTPGAHGASVVKPPAASKPVVVDKTPAPPKPNWLAIIAAIFRAIFGAKK